MQHLSSEEITSKCGLVLAIILKIVSIISFTVVIALNVDKLSNKLKTWFK